MKNEAAINITVKHRKESGFLQLNPSMSMASDSEAIVCVWSGAEQRKGRRRAKSKK